MTVSGRIFENVIKVNNLTPNYPAIISIYRRYFWTKRLYMSDRLIFSQVIQYVNILFFKNAEM